MPSHCMFYDWKISEMVHPGSALMTGMFFCILCMFLFCLKSIQICFFLGSRMFVICYKCKYSSDMFYDWKISEWYILDQHQWLVCFPVFCVYIFFCLKSIQICFVLGSRVFVICYKSKYSSDMFYDWNFSEVVHPGSALRTGMFFCILCMFCLSKEHPHMFFHIKIPLQKLQFTRIFQLW